MNILRFLLINFIGILFIFSSTSHAAIDYTVTPIRYELELQPGESITLPASIRNNGSETVTLPITTSDFQSSGPGGVPSLVRKSELVFPDQELSAWITLGFENLTLSPGEEGTINFTIDVPTTATPGGHYGAVLFKSPGKESGGGQISINVDYGIIILVNVSGEIFVGVEIDDPIISGGGTGGYGTNLNPLNPNSGVVQNTSTGVTYKEDITPYVQNPDNGWYIGVDDLGKPIFIYPDTCPLGDFTTSRYDKKCFGTTDPDLFSENGIPNDLREGILFQDDFEVKFQFPIKNTGNTHIKPSGKVVLKDENGVLKAIGREVVANDRGAIINQKIVDYIPINDQGGNILPQTKRIFESNWEGFPYKTFDDQGNPVVNYWSPSEYYTQKNKDEAGFLMFWERVSENRTHKNITADIELVYYDEDGNPIEFNTSKTFTVQYIEQVVSVNPYIILSLLLIATAVLLILGAIRGWVVLFKENRCWNCSEKIKSHWKTCPHCKVVQNKRQHREFQKEKESSIFNSPEKVVKKIRKAPVRSTVTKVKTTKKPVVKRKVTSKK